MLINKKVSKAFIISGNRNTSLRDQWKEKIDEFKDTFIDDEDNKGLSAVDARALKQISVVWGQDLLSKKGEPFRDSLIIWDESHYGSSQDQTLHKFLTQLGIYSSIQGSNNDNLEKNRIYILSVSATPVAEISANFTNEDSKKFIVCLEPGKGYRGVKYFNDKSKIHDSFVINEGNKESLRKILRNYIGLKKYFVIRVSDTKNKKKLTGLDILRLVTEESIEIKEYIADTKEEYILYFSTKPKALTVIRISEYQGWEMSFQKKIFVLYLRAHQKSKQIQLFKVY